MPCIRMLLSAMVLPAVLFASGPAPDPSRQWIDEIVRLPEQEGVGAAIPTLRLIRQDHERLEFGRSVIQTPLTLGAKPRSRGLGTHSASHIVVESEVPITRFSAVVGVDANPRTQGGAGSVVFSVVAAGKELLRSGTLRGGQEGETVAADVPRATRLELHVSDAGDGPACDHADWAEARVELADGRRYWLDELPLAGQDSLTSGGPFSFTYGGQPAEKLLVGWRRSEERVEQGEVHRRTISWDDPAGRLRVSWEVVRYDDFPAAEWMLWFENRGEQDTEVIADVLPLSIALRSPLAAPNPPYRLYRTKGGPACPADFEPSTLAVDQKHPQTLTAGQGRSSHADFPFFKVDTGRGTIVLAVGWSGMWNARLSCPDNRHLVVTAGLEKTHFRLKPGERVRSPRILALGWCGDTWDANARFRRLIYRHYAARRRTSEGPDAAASVRAPLPMLFCNTCFTRGGGWLNECNAENQISLIDAYAPLGLEALLTDAGWFEGGWPAGAGNWTPRRDAYPDGMGPVAAAARAKGMAYGLWFEPERVVAGTWLHRNRPEWLLRSQAGDQGTYLLDFGLPEVRQYFLEIVKGFMDLPGFRFYRQDFNMDPLPYWRFSDAADRQGITEMKYIQGLYAYWESIAEAWPDSIREECASGGNRIDLETVMRMHLHQKTDYWFDNETDQCSLWGLSQYLPNNVLVAHLNRMDEYSFHSVLPSSLCMGWIADAPDFDVKQGKKLLDRYLAVRHLLVGDWYPLLPFNHASDGWTGAQFHRPDLDEGMLLLYRRADSPYRAVDVKLRALAPARQYELEFLGGGGGRPRLRKSGAELAAGIYLSLEIGPRSDLVVYRAAGP